MSTKPSITKVWLPRALICVFALGGVFLTLGCSTLPPPGVDKAVWEHASPQYRARLHEEEAKRLAELERRVRRVIAQPPQLHEYAVNPSLPLLHEIIREVGKQVAASQDEIETVLFTLIEKAIASDGDSRRGISWGMAGGALSALAYLGTASTLNKVMAVASKLPATLDSDISHAAAYIAAREAPERIPEVARRLMKERSDPPIFTMLYHALKSLLPADETDRQRRMAIIVSVFKEGLQNRSYNDRIFLDRVLDELAPQYRTSEERRKFLVEEKGNNNMVVREYALRKLKEAFPD